MSGLISSCRIIEYSCNVNYNKHPKIGQAHLITIGKKIKKRLKKKWQFAKSYPIKGHNRHDL